MLKENNEIKPQDSTALQTEVMKDNIIRRMLVNYWPKEGQLNCNSFNIRA